MRKKIKKRLKKFTTPFLVGITSTLFLITTGAFLYYKERVFPRVSVVHINVSGKTENEIVNLLKNQIIPPEKITLKTNDQELEILLSEIEFSYNHQKTAEQAYKIARSGNFFSDFKKKLNLFSDPQNIDLEYTANQEKFDEFINVISQQISKEAIYPSVSLIENQAVVDKGTVGEYVDKEKLKNEISKSLKNADFSPVFIPFKSLDPTISDEKADALKSRAQNLLGKWIVFQHEYDTFVVDDEQIFSTLQANANFNPDTLKEIVAEIKAAFDREPQNAVFNFISGKVQEFTPAKDGIAVDENKLTELIIEKIKHLKTSEEKSVNVDVPVSRAAPQITTNQVNDLGINELLGRGSSRFRGSISSRIHNIGHAASKLNGVLIAPDKVFSFNKTLGDVSTLTGYKQAYIIKDGQTILGDGGGVCQVSTTLFRAVLDAGLPVAERRYHSYRVAYYEQGSPVGIDATVYDPTTDFKFINDTSGHLLIQTLFSSSARSLIFEIYGTSDGRIAKITKPVVSDVQPPPEDLYIDDPNLPIGKIEQIDYKAWGAKAKFYYSVEKEGEVVYEKTFYSNYQPWQAKFLRGTGNPQ